MELNTIQQQGKWSNIADRLNENFSAINSELLKILAKTRANKGFFETPTDLIEAYPTAVIGDVAYVGISDVFYIFKWDGTGWGNTGLTIEENIDINGVNERIEAIQSNLNTVSNELSQAISQETTNREALEARLSQEISNTQANIEQVNNALSQEISELAQTIAAETDTRERAMAAMAKNIQAMFDEERHWRELGDAELTQAIADETSNRERTMEAMARNILAMIDEERHLREEGDTPIIMTEEEYNAAVEGGEITETDTTIRYIVE